jgi:hypothetical protein
MATWGEKFKDVPATTITLPKAFGGATIPKEEPVTATGTAKAALTGVRSGPEGAVGFYGDVPELGGDLVGWLAKKLGVDEATAQKLAEQITHGTRFVMDPRAKLEQVARWLGYSKDTGELPHIMPTSGDVAAGTDWAVSQLPESVSGPIQDITRHHGRNPLERGVETAGTFAGAAFLPGGPIRRALNVAVPTAAVETAGAVTHELAPEYEDAARMVAGFLAGGMMAKGAPSFRLRSNLRKLSTTPEGVSRVKQLLKAMGYTEQDAAAELDKLQPGGMLVDVGQEEGSTLRQEAQRIQARGGEGRSILEKPLRAREQEANAMLTGDVAAAVGPRQQPSAIEEALKERLTLAQEKQKAAHPSQVQPVDLAQMADDIDAQLATAKSATEIAALKKVRKLLTEKPGDPTAQPPVAETLETTSQQVLKIRQAIRDELYSAKTGQIREDLSPGAKQVLQDAYDEINKGLDPANPTLRAADVDIHQIGKEEKAFETGQKIYENKPAYEGGVTEVEFKNTYDRMSPGEQQQVLNGLNVETYRQLGINANNRVKLMGLLKGEGKWNQQKVAAVIGDEKAQALMDALSRHKTFQESFQSIVRGSKTAETASGGKPESLAGAAIKAAPEVITTSILGSPHAGVATAFARLKDYVAQRRAAGIQPKLDADVARLLASNRGDDLVEAVQLLTQKGSPLPPAVAAALLARKQDLSERRGQ